MEAEQVEAEQAEAVVEPVEAEPVERVEHTEPETLTTQDHQGQSGQFLKSTLQ